MFTTEELQDIHLALIIRHERLVDQATSATSPESAASYQPAIQRFKALCDKVCILSLESQLGFSLPK